MKYVLGEQVLLYKYVGIDYGVDNKEDEYLNQYNINNRKANTAFT